MISKGVFLAQMQVLMQAYNHSLPEASLETYYTFLSKEFDDDLFRQAVKAIVLSSRRFPAISDFMESKKGSNAPWYCCG